MNKNLGVTVGRIKKETGGNTPLGKIMLRDINVVVFNSLEAARDYILRFTTAEITDESFDTDLNAYFFTVPPESYFNEVEADGFCGQMSGGETLQFVDEIGLVKYFGAGCFEENTMDNVVTKAVFDNPKCFLNSQGNNKLINVQVIGGFADNFFKNSLGKNEFLNCYIISNEAFSNCENQNTFYRCSFKGDYSFQNSKGINIFEDCEFANFNFSNSQGNNYFYGSTLFQGSCFYQATSNNFFYGNVTAGGGFFSMAQGGNNYFYKDLTVGNSGFTNAKSNNFINKIVSAGNNLFRTAAPKNKNEIVELVSCGSDAFRDYVGSIYFSILGEDNTQNLPANIFTVTTECCVNFNFSLKAYNDGDYVQMVANISLNPAQHQINLF